MKTRIYAAPAVKGLNSALTFIIIQLLYSTALWSQTEVPAHLLIFPGWFTWNLERNDDNNPLRVMLCDYFFPFVFVSRARAIIYYYQIEGIILGVLSIEYISHV